MIVASATVMHDDCEHAERVARDEPHAPPERVDDSPRLDHDCRHREAPVRQQDEPRDDEQDQAGRDADRGDEADCEQRPEARLDSAEHLADRQSGPSVAELLDDDDERALEPQRAEDRHAGRHGVQRLNTRRVDRRLDEREQPEDDRGDADQPSGVAGVEAPSLAENARESRASSRRAAGRAPCREPVRH